MNYTSITPATDWFYVHPKAPPETGAVVYHVPVFAVDGDTGDVVGLIPVFYGGVPKLVAPSDSLGGVYLHRDQLTEEEAELARSTR